MRVVCYEGLKPLLWGPPEGRESTVDMKLELPNYPFAVKCEVPSAKCEVGKSKIGKWSDCSD